LSKNTVTWPIVRAWPVVYVVGFVQASVTLLVGGLVCAIAGATTSAAKIGKRANWFIVLLLFMFPPAGPLDHIPDGRGVDIDFNPAPPNVHRSSRPALGAKEGGIARHPPPTRVAGAFRDRRRPRSHRRMHTIIRIIGAYGISGGGGPPSGGIA